MRIASLVVVMFIFNAGCGESDTDTSDGDTDTDSDSDTDADVGPDCGPYSGMGGVGTSWSFEHIYPSTWTPTTDTWTLTVTAFDPATGEIDASLVGVLTDSRSTNLASKGSFTWLCTSDGLFLKAKETTFTDMNTDTELAPDTWEYDPPLLLVPYTPEGTWTFEVSGTHTSDGTAFPFATTGTGSVLNAVAAVDLPVGSFTGPKLEIYNGSSHWFRLYAEGAGLVQEVDAVQNIFQNLTAHTE